MGLNKTLKMIQGRDRFSDKKLIEILKYEKTKIQNR